MVFALNGSSSVFLTNSLAVGVESGREWALHRPCLSLLVESAGCVGVWFESPLALPLPQTP